MSRSRRKTPIMGITGNNSTQKKFKQKEHKRERKLVNQKDLLIEECPNPKEFGNEWASPRDGKAWFGNCKYLKADKYINWPLEYKKWMRK